MIALLSKDDHEVTFNLKQVSGISQTPQSVITHAETSPSIYQPSEGFRTPPGENNEPCSSRREILNFFLTSREISPIRYSMITPWDEAAERTKRFHTRKARQVVIAELEEIAPQCADILLDSAQSCKEDECDIDSTLMGVVVECYENAGHLSTCRQMLSIIADKVSFKAVKRWIPNLSRYRYKITRHHVLLHDKGSPVPSRNNTRMKVLPLKFDHFLTFITSAYVMQDLPFGEKTLKLSSNTKIKIPNIERTMFPEQIVQQFIVPMSHSTLCRILKVCSASVRKYLQGLDDVSAEGVKAFDELVDVIDKLGDNHDKGLCWARDQNEKLKLAKRSLKGDFKVGVSRFKAE